MGRLEPKLISVRMKVGAYAGEIRELLEANGLELVALDRAELVDSRSLLTRAQDAAVTQFEKISGPPGTATFRDSRTPPAAKDPKLEASAAKSPAARRKST